MAAKPVQFRDLATHDLDSAADYYVAHAGANVALRFVNAVEAATRRVGKHPGLGSLRFAYELAIPDLRATTIGKFPYVMFYVECNDVIEVWRVLHAGQDIPTTLQDDSSD